MRTVVVLRQLWISLKFEGLNKWFWVLLLSDYYLNKVFTPDSFCCLPKASRTNCKHCAPRMSVSRQNFPRQQALGQGYRHALAALTCWCFDCLMRIMLCKRAFSQGKGLTDEVHVLRSTRTSNSKLSCPRQWQFLWWRISALWRNDFVEKAWTTGLHASPYFSQRLSDPLHFFPKYLQSGCCKKTADPPGFWGETAAAGGEDGSGDWKSGSRT